MSDHTNPPTPPGHAAGREMNETRSATAGHDFSEAPELVLDGPAADIEAAMRDALSAVEAVEGGDEARPAAGSPPAGSDPDPAEDGGTDTGEREVAALRREIADLRDRSMRTLADFDNFRKRAERERQEVRRYALLEPLREFLPVADNLERALQADGQAEDLKRGVEMILRQMQELLRRFGVREVPADGEPFNPAVHEAVARTESDAVTQPTVAETLVRGYTLHDKLLRPAMVKVAVPPETAVARQPAAGASGSEAAPGAPGDPGES
jgi:molecular chaperone GrpE